MQVAVLGSHRQEHQSWSLKHDEYFKPACQALGSSLARAQHRLLVATDAEETADKYVYEGFVHSGGRREDVTIMEESGALLASSQGAFHIVAASIADATIVVGGRDGSFNAGLTALCERKRLIPVGCFGGAAEKLLEYVNVHWRPDPQLSELKRLDPSRQSNWEDKLTGSIISFLETYPRILIIHGRSSDRNKVEKILRDAQHQFRNLPCLIIMQDTGSGTSILPQQFESLANLVDAAIAVVTPDDIGAPAIDEQGNPIPVLEMKPLQPRARENIWLEVGFFWGRLGREKLLVLGRPEVSVPSDFGGALYEKYDKSPEEVQEKIIKFIENLRTGRHSHVFGSIFPPSGSSANGPTGGFRL